MKWLSYWSTSNIDEYHLGKEKMCIQTRDCIQLHRIKVSVTKFLATKCPKKKRGSIESKQQNIHKLEKMRELCIIASAGSAGDTFLSGMNDMLMSRLLLLKRQTWTKARNKQVLMQCQDKNGEPQGVSDCNRAYTLEGRQQTLSQRKLNKFSVM